MRVLLVTSWDVPCGIADYARALKESVERADPGIEITPSVEALDPGWVFSERRLAQFDLIHLNHHDALHSRWQDFHVRELTDANIPVVLTYHDTREGVSDAPNSPKLHALTAVASSTIVHEPVADLKAIYWRQGVAAPATATMQHRPQYPQQPVLGTVGFNFPWKNYDRLAQVTGELGWGLLILCANAGTSDAERWQGLNPATMVIGDFLTVQTAVRYLSACDATAFMYECSNTGTSGAIRLGIAARKPVIALRGCRQFRDLLLDPLGNRAIRWADDWEGLTRWLQVIQPGRFDPLTHALAEQDSWTQRGKDHAYLYHVLTGGAPKE